jgi:putative phage-type endonuclease
MNSETVTHFHAAAEWTGIMDSDRDAWLDARHTMLTASDVAAVLGHDHRKDALAVYAEKITPRGPREEIGIDDPRFWGSALEQPILRAVSDYYGWGYQKGGALLRSRSAPWLGATLDAEVCIDGVWVDLEGKTTRVGKEWSEEEENIPVHIILQVQSQLLVTGAPYAVVFALLYGSTPCRVHMQPNLDLHALIREETEAFMARLRTLDPPPPGATSASARALARLHPVDDGSVVNLPPEALEWSRELREIAAQQKLLESRELQLKNLIKSSIGDAQFGVLPDAVEGKRFWRWKTQERAGHVVAPSSSRVLLAMKSGPRLALPHAPTTKQLLP